MTAHHATSSVAESLTVATNRHFIVHWYSDMVTVPVVEHGSTLYDACDFYYVAYISAA